MAKADIYDVTVGKDQFFTVNFGKKGRYEFFFDGENKLITITEHDPDGDAWAEVIFDGSVKELKLSTNHVNSGASPSKSLTDFLGLPVEHKTETAF